MKKRIREALINIVWWFGLPTLIFLHGLTMPASPLKPLEGYNWNWTDFSTWQISTSNRIAQVVLIYTIFGGVMFASWAAVQLQKIYFLNPSKTP
jgi:hypothetical protein